MYIIYVCTCCRRLYFQNLWGIVTRNLHWIKNCTPISVVEIQIFIYAPIKSTKDILHKLFVSINYDMFYPDFSLCTYVWGVKWPFFEKKNDEVGFYEGVARFTSKKLNICTSTHVKPSVMQAQHPKFFFSDSLVIFFNTFCHF